MGCLRLLFRILNSKELKDFLGVLRDGYGISSLPKLVFLRSSKDKFFVVSQEVGSSVFSGLRVENLGLYIGTLYDEGFRFSIEGSQLFGPLASKNILLLDDNGFLEWLRGHDLDVPPPGFEGFCLVKFRNDFVGGGKVRGSKLFNYVPKNRRLVTLNV